MKEISDSNYENTCHEKKRKHLSESVEEISDSNYENTCREEKRQRLSESAEEIIVPLKKNENTCHEKKRKRLSESAEEKSDSNDENTCQEEKRQHLSESVEETIVPSKKNENACHRVNESYTYSHKYKGVVPQQNGNWGAQIYSNNQRIWIGTFKTELDAAIAYDRASIKLRSSDAPRNFPWTETTVQEAKFQSLSSMDSILAMIKEGTYQSKFDDFLRKRTEKEKDNDISVQNEGPRLLFEKQLTPSDVGKLNRLVIPKKYAVMYFPRVPGTDKSQGFVNDELILSFYDFQNKKYEFRYCYWKSSQSFVFTRGWNQFVKEKGLKADDTISVCFQKNPKMQNAGFWLIDKRLPRSNIGPSLKLGLEDEVIQTSNVKTKGFKLFGVQII